MKLPSRDSRCSEKRSVTEACALTILLEQHRCMLQLRRSQPHILRAVKAHKRSQVLHFTLTFTVAFDFSNFVFSLAINFDRWYISMNTVTEPTAKQRDMKHIMNTTQRSTARQIRTISRIPNTFSNKERSYKTVTKFPCPMQPQVLCRQENLVANCIFNMPTVCISILLLIRLRLQQMTLHQLTKFLPTSYLILCSLYRVQTVQVVHRHAQRLSKRNVCW